MSTKACPCADQINTVATVAPLSRRRLTEIAKGAPASNYERKEIRWAERLTGVHMPDSCRGCPHAGADSCCGGCGMSTVLPAIRPQLICKNPIADSADLLAINRLCDNPTPDIERVLSLLQRYDDALLESQQECEELEVIADRDAPAVLDALDDLSTEAANLVCILEDLMPQIEQDLIEMDCDRLVEAITDVQTSIQVAGSYV